MLHLQFFAFIFSLLVSVLFFIKLFLQVYIQEAGEGTSPILSFLHPFVMSWNKKLSAESDIWYNKHQERHRIALTYICLLFFVTMIVPTNFADKRRGSDKITSYESLISTIILTTHNIFNWHNIPSCFIYEYTQF